MDQFELLTQIAQYETVRDKSEHLLVRMSAMVVGMGTNLRVSRARIRHLEKELERYREVYRRRKIQVDGDGDGDSDGEDSP